MDTIPCPNCGKQIQITQALRHQLEDKIRLVEQEKHKEKLEKAKAQVAFETEKRLKEESQKERGEFEKKVKAEALRKAEEEQSLKIKEKDLQLDEARKANDDLRRKLEQGSQQRQGEVLELDLEEKLKAKFPNDEFMPIPKGIEGGDIWQKVIYQGRVVGSILWETKRTKAWSNGWINKLKEDEAKIKASESILISQVLPTDSNSFDRKEGVWIAKYEHAISLARFVRFLLTNVATIKSSTSHTEEEWGRIRDYMTSDAFKHRMRAHIDGVITLKQMLDAEKRSTLLKWKKQEDQIDKLDLNIVNFYGDLKTIVPNLPEVKGIDAPMLGTLGDKMNEKQKNIETDI